MSKRRDDKVKMSDICGTCRGTGTVKKDVAESVRNSKGEVVMVTRVTDVVCPQCGGLGEYEMI